MELQEQCPGWHVTQTDSHGNPNVFNVEPNEGEVSKGIALGKFN
jgi:hypothetical protein